MQKSVPHPYWSKAFVYYEQLTSMVDFFNRNARFVGLFSGEVPPDRVSFPLAALILFQVLRTGSLMKMTDLLSRL